MDTLTDHKDQLLFTPLFTHDTLTFAAECLPSAPVDVVTTDNGNRWFYAAAVLEVMGFEHRKHDARRLQRIDHPDKIKITETPFRFPDGRRNRGTLISPRAVVEFSKGGVKGFNAIKAIAFVGWMNDTLLIEGKDADDWSPARKPAATLAPTFRKVIRVTEEDEDGNPLDPFRPRGVYHGLQAMGPLQEDEVEFEIDGFGKKYKLPPIQVDDGVVIDLYDVF